LIFQTLVLLRQKDHLPASEVLLQQVASLEMERWQVVEKEW
jgi:hypothetical protein